METINDNPNKLINKKFNYPYANDESDYFSIKLLISESEKQQINSLLN